MCVCGVHVYEVCGWVVECVDPLGAQKVNPLQINSFLADN